MYWTRSFGCVYVLCFLLVIASVNIHMYLIFSMAAMFAISEFLGRTEIRVSEVYERRQRSLGVINFTDLRLLEVPSGTVSLRVDLQLFREAPQII